MPGKQDGKWNFFGSCVEQWLLPKAHELLDIDTIAVFSSVEGEAAGLYCAGAGRPSYQKEQAYRLARMEPG